MTGKKKVAAKEDSKETPSFNTHHSVYYSYQYNSQPRGFKSEEDKLKKTNFSKTCNLYNELSSAYP